MQTRRRWLRVYMLGRIGCWRRHRARSSPLAFLHSAHSNTHTPSHSHRYVQLQAHRPCAHSRPHRHLFCRAHPSLTRRGRDPQPQHRRLWRRDCRRWHRRSESRRHVLAVNTAPCLGGSIRILALHIFMICTRFAPSRSLPQTHMY